MPFKTLYCFIRGQLHHVTSMEGPVATLSRFSTFFGMQGGHRFQDQFYSRPELGLDALGSKILGFLSRAATCCSEHRRDRCLLKQRI